MKRKLKKYIFIVFSVLTICIIFTHPLYAEDKIKNEKFLSEKYINDNKLELRKSADPIEAGEILRKANLIKGSENGDLKSDYHLNRQDAIIMLYRLMSELENEVNETSIHKYQVSNTNEFKDVTSAYYKPYIDYAFDRGWIKGRNKNTFGFGDTIKLKEFLAMISRFSGYKFEYSEITERSFEIGYLDGLDLDKDDILMRGDSFSIILNAIIEKNNRVSALTKLQDNHKEDNEKTEDDEKNSNSKINDLKIDKIFSDNLKVITVYLDEEVCEKDLEKVKFYKVDEEPDKSNENIYKNDKEDKNEDDEDENEIKISDIRLAEDLKSCEFYISDKIENKDIIELVLSKDDYNIDKNLKYRLKMEDKIKPEILHAEFINPVTLKIIASEPLNIINPNLTEMQKLEMKKKQIEDLQDMNEYDQVNTVRENQEREKALEDEKNETKILMQNPIIASSPELQRYVMMGFNPFENRHIKISGYTPIATIIKVDGNEYTFILDKMPRSGFHSLEIYGFEDYAGKLTDKFTLNLEIEEDKEGPYIVNAENLDATKLKITFDEPLKNIGAFIVGAGGIKSAKIDSLDRSIVYLTLKNKLGKSSREKCTIEFGYQTDFYDNKREGFNKVSFIPTDSTETPSCKLISAEEDEILITFSQPMQAKEGIYRLYLSEDYENKEDKNEFDNEDNKQIKYYKISKDEDMINKVFYITPISWVSEDMSALLIKCPELKDYENKDITLVLEDFVANTISGKSMRKQKFEIKLK